MWRECAWNSGAGWTGADDAEPICVLFLGRDAALRRPVGAARRPYYFGRPALSWEGHLGNRLLADQKEQGPCQIKNGAWMHAMI